MYAVQDSVRKHAVTLCPVSDVSPVYFVQIYNEHRRKKPYIDRISHLSDSSPIIFAPGADYFTHSYSLTFANS